MQAREGHGNKTWAAVWRCLALAVCLGLASGRPLAADQLVDTPVGHDYALARESVIEAIESEGLVVGSILPFADMLARTAGVTGGQDSPLRRGEVIQFCSAHLAWAMVREAPAQLAYCPMSLALIEAQATPGQVRLVYRLTDAATPARRQANDWLARIVRRSLSLIGLPEN